LATLILEKPRPVRWRRRLRGACFWTAVALATIALVEELELNAAVAALAIPAAVLALRDLVRALRFRREGRLAERVSKGLRDELGDEYVVLTEYEPRDGLAEHVAIVVVGPPGIFVVEPVAGDGALACYQDHWYRGADGATHRLADSPSKRARSNASRVRSDISSGGHIRAVVNAFVLLERARASDCASSTVPVIAGVHALARELRSRAPRSDASPRYTRAVAEALTHPVPIAVAG